MPFPNRLNIRVSLCVPPELNKLDESEGKFPNIEPLQLWTQKPFSLFMCLSFSTLPPVSRRKQTNKQQWGKAPMGLVSMAAWADSTHPRAPRG